MAHAIHDRLGHQLLALKTAVAQARDRPDADAPLPDRLDQIETMSTKCLTTARDIAYRLRRLTVDRLSGRVA